MEMFISFLFVVTFPLVNNVTTGKQKQTKTLWYTNNPKNVNLDVSFTWITAALSTSYP